MQRRKLENISMLLGSTLLGAIGQVLFKYALAVNMLLIIGVGILAYFFSTIIYFYVLTRANLSWAYSIGGLSYIFAVLLAATVLGETVTPLRWLGVLIISAGVVLVGAS
ncbi:EamA family transporter [Candidatus Marsarchaeota archaeon]|nr:EamA family transporter [Candidatus Marsarchaeota archaeon]MCL5404331.1 EamA family transporter [Candidatus Marsarchaeota archaeon]